MGQVKLHHEVELGLVDVLNVLGVGHISSLFLVMFLNKGVRKVLSARFDFVHINGVNTNDVYDTEDDGHEPEPTQPLQAGD